ncbi:MAG TPA: flagellar hook-basal body complex protein FliE [Burkholderiaceae bacterium]|nr:flagellar hook-basal body complex protein FliE [Burkholderiaceae bacterium]
MAPNSLTSIQTVLEQMRALRESMPVFTQAKQTQAPDSPTSFATELQNRLQSVSALQNSAASQAKAFQTGSPDVSLSDVMIDLQKADLAFQTTVQVRNRLVAAYQEIANMPV